MTILSFIQPTEFNWDILRSGVKLGDDAADDQVRLAEEEDTLEERKSLKRASRIAIIVGGGIVFCIVVLWLMPMYGSRYIFSKQCTALPISTSLSLQLLKPLCKVDTFVDFSFHWMGSGRVYLAMARCAIHNLFPLWESRASFIRLYKLLTGKAKFSPVEGVTRNLRGHVPSDDEKKVIDQETAIEEDRYKPV